MITKNTVVTRALFVAAYEMRWQRAHGDKSWPVTSEAQSPSWCSIGEKHFLGSARAVVEWRVPVLIVLRNSALSLALSRFPSPAKSNFINYTAALNELERKQMRRRLLEARRESLVTCAVITLPLANIYPLMAWLQRSRRSIGRAGERAAQNPSCLSLFNGRLSSTRALCSWADRECCMRTRTERSLCWRGFFSPYLQEEKCKRESESVFLNSSSRLFVEFSFIL